MNGDSSSIALWLITLAISLASHCGLCQVFRDLEMLRENKLVKSSKLLIKSEMLGKGGFGFVCMGELVQERDSVCVEVSAVTSSFFAHCSLIVLFRRGK